MSFSVCSSGPLCDFPRLSAARLMLSRAFSSTVTFRGSSFYGFAASLCSSLRLSRFFAVTFRGFAASLCSSLRLFRFFAVTRQGFDALHRDFPWLVFLWLCRLFSLCSSLRLSRFFAVTRQGFQVLATLRHNIPELYIPRYGSSLLAFLKLSWLSRASIANCKNTT